MVRREYHQMYYESLVGFDVKHGNPHLFLMQALMVIVMRRLREYMFL